MKPAVLSGAGVFAAGVFEDVGSLESNETAVRARERNYFGLSVDGLGTRSMRELDAFVPTVPLLVPAERAVLAGAPAVKEVEELLCALHAQLPVRALNA
jgi:hypothetical protein